MHKEMKPERKTEYDDAEELLSQLLTEGDIIGVSDNGNPITWNFYYIIGINIDGAHREIHLSHNVNGKVPMDEDLIIHEDDNIEGQFFLHIPMVNARDKWHLTNERSKQEIIHNIFKLSFDEVHWTTRNLESIIEESNGELTREELVDFIENNARWFRRLNDGRYEYLPLNHPELLQPQNRRGARGYPGNPAPPLPNREPLELVLPNQQRQRRNQRNNPRM